MTSKSITPTFSSSHHNLILQLQNHLQKHQYFSKDSLPGLSDSLIVSIFNTEFPCKKQFPYIYYWFINIKQFSPTAMQKWTIRSDFDPFCEGVLEQWSKWGELACRSAEVIAKIKCVKFQYKLNITFKDATPTEISRMICLIQKKYGMWQCRCKMPLQISTKQTALTQQNLNPNISIAKLPSTIAITTTTTSTTLNPSNSQLKLLSSSTPDTHINLNLQCTPKDIQVIKGILDACKKVSNYEVAKGKDTRGKRTSIFFVRGGPGGSSGGLTGGLTGGPPGISGISGICEVDRKVRDWDRRVREWEKDEEDCSETEDNSDDK